MTTFYSIISKFVKGRPPYAILSATTQWIFTFHCTDFIAKYEWPPNSPDLNPLDYHVWGAMLQAFHKLHSKPKTIPELKPALQQIWDDLPQTTINMAINDFCKVWMHAPRPVMDILNIWYKLYTEIFRLNSVSCFRNHNKLCVFNRSFIVKQ